MQTMRSTIETQRLLLLPGRNERDSAAFLTMLKEDGDFQMFCGVEYSEANLYAFQGYMAREHMYAIYRRNDDPSLLGYVGITERPAGNRWEAEFYVKRSQRRNGYCKEALISLCGAAFRGEGFPPGLDAVYATTTIENEPAKAVLERCGFVPSEAAMVVELMIDPKTGELHSVHAAEYVLWK